MNWEIKFGVTCKADKLRTRRNTVFAFAGSTPNLRAACFEASILASFLAALFTQSQMDSSKSAILNAKGCIAQN
jgi:hypothetical protein